MSRAVLLLVLALLSACHETTTFDDRFNATSDEIEQRAAALDRQANGGAVAVQHGKTDNNQTAPDR